MQLPFPKFTKQAHLPPLLTSTYLPHSFEFQNTALHMTNAWPLVDIPAVYLRHSGTGLTKEKSETGKATFERHSAVVQSCTDRKETHQQFIQQYTIHVGRRLSSTAPPLPCHGYSSRHEHEQNSVLATQLLYSGDNNRLYILYCEGRQHKLRQFPQWRFWFPWWFSQHTPSTTGRITVCYTP